MQGIRQETAAAQRLLAKKSPAGALKSENSLLAGNLSGDRRDQHCGASQAVWRSDKMPLIRAERRANGGLLGISCQSPGSDFGHYRGEMGLRRGFQRRSFLGGLG